MRRTFAGGGATVFTGRGGLEGGRAGDDLAAFFVDGGVEGGVTDVAEGAGGEGDRRCWILRSALSRHCK